MLAPQAPRFVKVHVQIPKDNRVHEALQGLLVVGQVLQRTPAMPSQIVMDPIVLGDLNVDLDKARSLRSQHVLDLLAKYGLIDLVQYFRQRHRFQDLNTWPQVSQVTVL